jgi:putative hydrolase of the HAD superfamily
VLSELARRYPLGIVSNFYGNLDAVCEELGIRALFRVIVDSEQVGCRKPDPRIFRHALDELGVKPADATFVGDSPSRDMAGARGVGMAHIWLVGEAAWHPPPCCPGDPIIRSLETLRGLLL